MPKKPQSKEATPSDKKPEASPKKPVKRSRKEGPIEPHEIASGMTPDQMRQLLRELMPPSKKREGKSQQTQEGLSEEASLLSMIRDVGEQAAQRTLDKLSSPPPAAQDQGEKKTLRQMYASASSALTLMQDEDLLRELAEQYPNAPWVQQWKLSQQNSTTPPTTDSSSPKSDSPDLP